MGSSAAARGGWAEGTWGPPSRAEGPLEVQKPKPGAARREKRNSASAGAGSWGVDPGAAPAFPSPFAPSPPAPADPTGSPGTVPSPAVLGVQGGGTPTTRSPGGRRVPSRCFSLARKGPRRSESFSRALRGLEILPRPKRRPGNSEQMLGKKVLAERQIAGGAGGAGLPRSARKDCHAAPSG